MAACGPHEPPAPGTPHPETRRSLQDGDVVGFVGRDGVHVWRGIPFAEPPVGPLRWRAPRPPEPWEGVREALAFGPACPQIAIPGGGWDGAKGGEPTGDEDCLTLNVYAPAFALDGVPRGRKRRPVLFWIHGGGNSVGDALLYDATRLVKSHELIVVTVQYRLGPLGWFRHASLRGMGSSAEDRSGNYGTLDLIRGLEWVRENIAAFGGDPRNVTIFGESAGGVNVMSLIVSPLARGLFQRAVVQSGTARSFSPAEAENLTDASEPGHEGSSNEALVRLFAESAAGETPEARRSVGLARLCGTEPAALAARLRSLSAAQLLRLYDGRGGSGMLMMPAVFRDGFVLPEDPFGEVLADGRYNQVPTILGTNRDEMKLFMSFDPKWVRTVFRIPLWPRDLQSYDRAAYYGSTVIKAIGVDEPAEIMRKVQGPSVWTYRFDWDELPSFLWWDLPTLLGAAHGLEVPFVFGRFELGRIGRFLFDSQSEPGRVELSTAMMSYWAQLAWHGDPGRGRDGSLPLWKPWDTDGATSLVLDTDDGGGIRMIDERVSVEGLVQQALEDPRIADDAARCEILRGLAARAPELAMERVDALPPCAGVRAAGG